MKYSKIEDFLRETTSYVAFKFDRGKIKDELRDHMEDKLEYYLKSGCQPEEAEERVVEEMGDAQEIGQELNKQHNSILGWTWMASGILLLFLLVLNVYSMYQNYYLTYEGTDPGKPWQWIPKENIEYVVDVKERRKIDSTILTVDKLVYEKDGKLTVFYRHYDIGSFGYGGLAQLGQVKDDLGNIYTEESAGGYGGMFIHTSSRTFQNFSRQAKHLIIDYDRYGRSFHIDIPLKAGGQYE